MLSSANGFTVIEAIIALAIVTAGVVSLTSLTRQVTDTVARSRRHLSAAVLADAFVSQRLGDAMTATPADCLDRDVGGCVEPLDGAGRPTTGGPIFLRRWRILPVPAAPVPTWRLTVCVVPVDERRAARSAAGACVVRLMAEVAP